MILPSKHLSIDRSLIGLGSELINLIKKPMSVSSLWEVAKQIKQIRTFESFNLTLNLLYVMGAIKFEDGKIKRVN